MDILGKDPKMGVVVGIIGCGHWGKNHAKTFAQLKKENVIDDFVVCDILNDRAEEVASLYNVKWCTDASDLINNHGVTAVTIATPTSTHTEMTITFLKSGIDTLVEKPMTLEVDEAERMLSVAANTDRIFAIGHPLRYHAPLLVAKEMIDSGHLGPIHSIECDRLSVREPRQDTGVIAALAIHDIDICSMLLDEQTPTLVHALSLPSSVKGVEDHAVIHLKFAPDQFDSGDGVSATLTSSWRSRIRGKVRRTRIHGRDASIDIDTNRHDGFHIHYHPNNIIGDEWGGISKSPREWISIEAGEPCLTSELRAFALACRTRDRNHIQATPKIGLAATRLVTLARHSAQHHTPVFVYDSSSQHSRAESMSPPSWQ